MGFGQNRKYKGSILFSTLFLALLGSVLMVALLENYRLSADLHVRVKHFYLAKTMKQMFLSEYGPRLETGEETLKEGTYHYSAGTVIYRQVKQKVELQIEVAPFTFEFTEELSGTENDTENRNVRENALFSVITLFPTKKCLAFHK
ncbi:MULTISPECIES: competence type IV pilus minor pilin ComGG [unclassified Enterococcus]|uniref:competence type IV pilus minor pilin ComGG n=1 Tax=unclassified Enterococcus TaxID=2608891 RepID=UPI001F155608|nr:MULTISPECIES: competence type IV pilus minor pilin ComGG [unclassified Enterococcus]